jgi:uncharacterized OsmC-like protein
MSEQTPTNTTPKEPPMSTSTKTREIKPLNGVDTPTLFATINAVGEQPALAKFQWRATNQWISGTHSRTTIQTYTGAGGEQTRETAFEYDADHTKVLCGEDKGPTPVEFILHGLAACLTAGIGNIAAARGIELSKVESTVEGDMDLRGILGLSDRVRNGYEEIRIHFTVEGDAPAEKLQKLVEQSKARSAVFDILTNKTPVQVTVG